MQAHSPGAAALSSPAHMRCLGKRWAQARSKPQETVGNKASSLHSARYCVTRMEHGERKCIPQGDTRARESWGTDTQTKVLLPDTPTDRSCLMYNHCAALWQLPFYPEWGHNPPNIQHPNLHGHTAIGARVANQDIHPWHKKPPLLIYWLNRNYPGLWDMDTASSSLISTRATSAQTTLGGAAPQQSPHSHPKTPHANAGPCINPEQVVMMSESPGSAPRPSCKHDSDTWQPKLLRCVSKTPILAPRLHPRGCCTVFSHTAKPTGPSDATLTSNSPLKSTSWHFNTKRFFPEKLSKSLQVMHWISSHNRHLPSKVSPARRGTSFCAADVNPYLSPLQSWTEKKMKLVFLASCIFQDSVSRKKMLQCHNQGDWAETPTASVAGNPLCTSACYVAQDSERTQVCILAKLMSGWTAKQLITNKVKELSELRLSSCQGDPADSHSNQTPSQLMVDPESSRDPPQVMKSSLKRRCGTGQGHKFQQQSSPCSGPDSYITYVLDTSLSCEL